MPSRRRQKLAHALQPLPPLELLLPIGPRHRPWGRARDRSHWMFAIERRNGQWARRRRQQQAEPHSPPWAAPGASPSRNLAALLANGARDVGSPSPAVRPRRAARRSVCCWLLAALYVKKNGELSVEGSRGEKACFFPPFVSCRLLTRRIHHSVGLARPCARVAQMPCHAMPSCQRPQERERGEGGGVPLPVRVVDEATHDSIAIGRTCRVCWMPLAAGVGKFFFFFLSPCAAL